ncbi:SusC/RagA family TonB-linked outer membrane protein [Mucilaginibacter hurinus]|uniref:SusC/RagA family TonB-linked outer membrane protein n=1 Tax=Mucilaginibacter hurinus TaxID=2201324 RepID=A0A367GPD4_9SPHI|nr:SusC/RagA family TonB-linked outer membrane protein [Mucilaginibacter hurinus]RCH55352.1 SusC/RagA family TonB-linked outer membrane protein [Mucilaginibacter hurinus]
MLSCYLKNYFTVAAVTFLLLQISYQSPIYAKTQHAPADTLTGKVVDDYGHALQGVKVGVQGTTLTVYTAANGEFNIAAPVKSKLYFHYKGYLDAEKLITDTGAILVKLTPSYLQQPDTVNILYGRTRIDNIVGSISSIYTNQVTTTPSPVYSVALAGRLAGLYTEQYSGWPQADASSLLTFFYISVPSNTGRAPEPTDNKEVNLQLRGPLKPVTIVDGVQRDLFSIDPENIESISVLKDGLSTILLGQRSSNGVLLITTKKARAGSPRVSFTAQTGFQNPLKMPEPLSAYEYAYLYNEARTNEGKTAQYTPEDLQAYKDGSNPYLHPDVNWFKTILRRNAPIRRYNLNVGGGGNFARYHLSLGYLDQDGMFITSPDNTYNTNNKLKRYTISSSVEITPNKNFEVALKFLGRIQDSNEPGSNFSTLLSELYTTPNNAYPVFNPNKSFGGNSIYQTNLYAQTVNSGYFPKYAKDLVVDLELNYKFDRWVPGLYSKIKGNFSVLSSNAAARNRTNEVYRYTLNNNEPTYTRYGQITDPNNEFRLTASAQYVYAQVMAGYNKQFGAHNINASLFADMRSVTLNFELPGTYRNYAGKIDYNYKNKYFAQAAVNRSGYDRFKPGIQFGTFYGGGLGWKISEENFIKEHISWINLLKLRTTFAKTGNANVGYFIWRKGYGSQDSRLYYFGAGLNPAQYDYLSELALTNENATWEKANKFDIGVDLSILNDRLQFTADYYNNKFYDLMQVRGKTSALIGNVYNTENIGINRYTGMEFTATYKNKLNSFHYFVTGNVSFMQSRVLFMDEVIQPNSFNKRTGQPVNAPFGYLADGFFATQEEASSSPTVSGYTAKAGDIRFKDIGGPDTNPDGSPKPDGVINQFDQTFLGSKKPLLFYGVTIGFNYKGFDLTALVQGVGNRVIMTEMNALSVAFLGSGTYTGQAYKQHLNRWTPETASSASYPRLSDAATINNNVPSSFWMHSGNYFRLKNIDVGYTLPISWTSKIKVSSLRIFANGLNLFTDPGYDIYDPEQAQNVFNYPIQKVFNLGVNIKL